MVSGVPGGPSLKGQNCDISAPIVPLFKLRGWQDRQWLELITGLSYQGGGMTFQSLCPHPGPGLMFSQVPRFCTQV